MAFYQELDNIVNTVISQYILNNQNICKLLYYYPETKDYRFDPLEQPDILNTSDLLMDYIYPMPKSPETEIEQKGFMTVVLTGSNYINNNKGFRRVNLVFDLIFHLNAWIIKNSIRPYRLANEIDSLFNFQILKNLPIMGRPVSDTFAVRQYSSAYYGVQLVYDLTLNSNIECFPSMKEC